MSDSDSSDGGYQNGNEYQIKPSKGGSKVDTSKWPLLLKVRILTFSAQLFCVEF